MPLGNHSLKHRKGSLGNSYRSQNWTRETVPTTHRQGHYSEEDWDNTIVDTSVFHHQYINSDEKTDNLDENNSYLLHNGGEKKLSIGCLLSGSSRKQSQMYGEPIQNTIPEADRIHIYLTQENGRTISVQHLPSNDGRHILETTLQTNGWWIDWLKPTDEEMHIMAKLLRIHPLTVEDILSNEPTEKIELFPNYTFVSIRSFEVDQATNQIHPYNFYNLIFKRGLLTIHFKSSSHPARVRHRLDRIKHNMLIVPDWIHYALIDDITDAYAPIVSQIEIETVSVDELSLMLHKSERFDMLKRISRCRKRASQLSRLLTTKVDVMKSLIKRYDEKWQRAGGYGALMVDEHSTLTPEEVTALKTLNEVLLYLGDIQDHLITMQQNMNHYNRILARAHFNYLAQVNVDLSQTYRATNTVMNRLTFLGTVFIPIIFVAALWGMNVKVPGQEYLDDIWFHWITIGMVLYSGLLTYFGKKWNVL